MDTDPEMQAHPETRAVQEVVDAHEKLTHLRRRVNDFEHREALDDVLRKLETALSLLAVKTGGML